MKILKLKDMIGGWFVGGFEPTAYHTPDFEVGIKKFKKGEQVEFHFHKEGTEVNVLNKGKIILHGKEINEGDIFILYPYEITDPEFLEDTEIIVVKTISNTKDKYVIDLKN